MVSSRSTADIVLDVLIKSGESFNLYQLSKRSELSHQRIAYVLPKLLKLGLIVLTDNDGGKYYSVQRIHVDEELIEDILGAVEPLIEKIYGQLDLTNTENEEEALTENIALFISRQMLNIK